MLESFPFKKIYLFLSHDVCSAALCSALAFYDYPALELKHQACLFALNLQGVYPLDIAIYRDFSGV